MNTLCSTRQATAIATDKKFAHVRVNLIDMAQPAAVSDAAAITAANPNASASASAVPARDDQAAQPLDQVRDRVERRHGPEPVRLDQVPRQVHRREEQPDEEEREEPLDRLARARPQREERAERTERDRDRSREDDQDDPADDARFEPHADDQPDREVEAVLDEGQHRDPAELPDDQRAAAAAASARAGSGTRSGCRARDRCPRSSSRRARPG